MKRIGSLMVFFGVFAIVLNFFDAVPRLLAWIYNWGDTAAWAIKIGLVVVGGILWLLASRGEQTEVTDTETDTE